MSQTPSTSIPLHLLPLGFRFRPTDEELINYYLKLKIKGRINPSDADAIAEVDVCRFEPWDLPARSAIRSDDPEWFFFAPVDRKYPSGNRSNRATEAGYWKATGKDRFIRSRTPGGTGVVGMKKTLVFHMGRAPRGERTHWIMHEYRTVEREFEEGGFVLCRLFRKPVETVSQTFTPEPEESGFSPTLTKSSPSNTLHIDDVVEGEFAASLNEKTPESNMQEKSQLLPDTINNQLTESKLDDKAYYLIPYPNKTEESHSNGNMTTDEGGQIAKRKDAALYDELLGFLGPEYEHLLSDEFPQTKAICSDVDQGILTKIQYPKLEEDSVLDFLESIISTPEMSYGLSGNETCSATEAAPQQYNVVHEGSWNSLMDNDTCSSRVADSEALFAQGGEGLEALSQGRRLFGTSRSLQLDTSNRHNEIRRSLEVVHSIKRRGSRKLTAPIESGTLPAHSTKHAEDSVGQTNSLETEINIRLRNLENLESSTDFTRQQGTAERRIKLQSLKPIEKKLKLRNSDYTRLPLNIVTDEVDKDIKNQTADNEISEPAVFGDFELHSCDNDFSADIRIALCLQEVEKPSLRSRQREMSVADNKMEGSSLHEATSRVGSIPTHRIGVAVLVIASLICAGAVWFLNY